MLNREPTEFRLDGFRLHLRASIAFRERGTPHGVFFYLSLLDDEIDDRCEHFFATPDVAANFPDAATRLELTDALVSYCRGGAITVIRGGSCTFPLFWTRQATTVRLSTALPVHKAKFRIAGFAPAIAALCLPGSFEPNACTETPVSAWHRFRRGALTTFERDGSLREDVVPDASNASLTDAHLDERAISERIRIAFEEYARSQRHVTSSILELSGGFDSTLAGAAALRTHHTMRGISMEFPYYEFRFEAPVQRAVAGALGIPRTVVDGRDVFPYSVCDRPARFDEPAFFVTGLRHAERVGSFAASHHTTKIYMGHGGDHLFSSDLFENETLSPRPAREAFSVAMSRRIEQAIAQMTDPVWLRRSTGCFTYEGRQDIWIKETFGVMIRTPFTDLSLFRAAQLWSRWSAANRSRPDKTILSLALPDFLPRVVTERKGKVAYDGVWMRAYRDQEEHIARTIERASSSLQHIGISPAWILRRVHRLANWEPVSDREVLAAYAIAVWLLSWGVERVSDAAWE